MPLWHTVDPAKHGLSSTGKSFALDSETVRILRSEIGDVPVYFLENPRFFTAPRSGGIYVDAAGRDYADSPARYDFFSRASLEALKTLGIRPDVVHANDHHLGAVPWYAGRDPHFARSLRVLSIHNAVYQGIFPASRIAETGLDRALVFDHMGPAEYHGRVNPLKLGIETADVVLTVSPTYAREIRDWRFGAGLEGALAGRAREGRLIGILNGIDHRAWNPATDPHLWTPYDPATVGRKGDNKARLQEIYFGAGGVDPRIPLIATVTRLSDQKGIEEILHAAELLASSRRRFQYVLHGNPDGTYAPRIRDLAARFPDRVAYDGAFETAKEHRIVAGADFFFTGDADGRRHERRCSLHVV